MEVYDELERALKENERLNKENKILRENAEHNDKVVDKVNWENKRVSVCDILLNKLQELKGSESNDKF